VSGCQKLQNDGLTRSGTGCYRPTHMAKVGAKGPQVTTLVCRQYVYSPDRVCCNYILFSFTYSWRWMSESRMMLTRLALVSGDRQILAGRREDAELLLPIRASTSSSTSGRQTFQLENMIVRTSVMTTRMMMTMRVILEHRSILVQQYLTVQRRRLHATVSTIVHHYVSFPAFLFTF